jgi:Ca-activated chloride channel family protein
MNIRNLLILFLLSILNSVNGQSAMVSPAAFDFGVVKQWKNDTAYFTVENTGTSKFVFLPIGYSEDVLVILPKGSIEVGQSPIVKFIYYTQDRGNFRKTVPIYISSSNDPLELTVKGKIIDFHPDAMLNCPSMTDNPPPATTEKPVEIQVVDAISGEGLKGFDIIVKNPTDQFLIEKASKDRVYFDNLKNGKYTVNVSLSGYESKEQVIIISRVTRKFIIKLQPDEGPIVMAPPDNTKKEDETITLEKPNETEEERLDIEKLREKFNDKFKDKRIIEKDVIIVQDGENDSLPKEKEVSVKTDLPDFTATGTLNKDKYASNNIVFLIDVSTSMDRPEKLPYLKKSVKDMVKVLREEDLVTMIVYSSKVNILLQGEPGNHKEKIFEVIDGLSAKGLSHGTEGMNIAYANASQNFISNGNNQIILVSDGIFNSENFSPKTMYKLAKEKAELEAIKTSAIGFGKNAEAIEFMKTLAENGSGNFIRILSENDAATVLVNEIMQNSIKQ